VKKLIEKSYKVFATSRNPDADRASHLRQLFPGLGLLPGDLSVEGSFDKAIEQSGAKVIFCCTATPQVQGVDQVDAAVNGLLNLLRSAAKSSSVRRIILTSTLGTISSPQSNQPINYVFTENDWVDAPPSTALQARLQAEKTALEFSSKFPDAKFDVIVMNTGGVLGAPLGNQLDSSVKFFKSVVDGTAFKAGGVISFAAPIIHVKDVAAAHVIAAEKKDASGRYILGSPLALSFLDMAHVIKKQWEI